jgi:hypothetical protein
MIAAVIGSMMIVLHLEKVVCFGEAGHRSYQPNGM